MYLKPWSHLAEYIFRLFTIRDKFGYRKQSETNRNDENALCDYSSEYLRVCFRLYEDSSRPSLNILQTFCERSNIAEDLKGKLRTVSEKYANSSKYQ